MVLANFWNNIPLLEEMRQLQLDDLKMFDQSETNLDDLYFRQLWTNISWHKQFVFVLLFSPWVMTKHLLKRSLPLVNHHFNTTSKRSPELLKSLMKIICKLTASKLKLLKFQANWSFHVIQLTLSVRLEDAKEQKCWYKIKGGNFLES